jgi:heme/copper-type cytochrome/quinol oxidase subunit 3
MTSNSAGRVAHPFDSAAQQREAGMLAMWAFLVTEVMFFGGLFAGYAVYRYNYTPPPSRPPAAAWTSCSGP